MLIDVGQRQIVTLAIHALFLVLTFIAGFISLVLVRRKRDAARGGFTLLKVIWGLSLLSLATWFISFGGRPDPFNKASREAFWVGAALWDTSHSIVQVCIVYMHVLIGLGILYARKPESEPARHHALVKWSAAVSCGVVLVLTVAAFGLEVDHGLNVQPRRLGEVDPQLAKWMATTRMWAAVEILTFILALVVLAGTILVQMKVYGPSPKLRGSSALLISSAALLVISNLVRVIISLMYYPPSGTVEYDFEEYLPAVSFALINIPTWVLLVILLVLGAKKGGGIWTTQQPWTAGINWNPNHQGMHEQGHTYGVPMQQPPMQGWQQQGPYQQQPQQQPQQQLQQQPQQQQQQQPYR